MVDDDVYQPPHSDSAAFGYWPIKVTHWTLTVQVFYLWLSTYTAHKATEDGAPAEMPWFATIIAHLWAIFACHLDGLVTDYIMLNVLYNPSIWIKSGKMPLPPPNISRPERAQTV